MRLKPSICILLQILAFISCSDAGQFQIAFDTEAVLGESGQSFCSDFDFELYPDRIRYEQESAATCSAETQKALCGKGEFQNYSGTYEFESCSESRLFYSKLKPDLGESCEELSYTVTRACTDNVCEEWQLNFGYPYDRCGDFEIPPSSIADFSGDVYNDSVGHQARFRWVGANDAATVALAYSSDLSELEAWQGESTTEFSNGGLVFDYDDCSGQALNEDGLAVGGEEYSSSLTSGLITGNSRCAINLASTDMAGGALDPWQKRYFRIAFLLNDTIELSQIYAAANVPSGMVYVDADLWPQNWYPHESFPICTNPTTKAGITGCRFSFAIDKYEVSNPDPVGYQSEDYPNAYDKVLLSVRDQAAFNGNTTTGALKQGCLNRSFEAEFSSYVNISDLPIGDKGTTPTPTPLRKFHLVSSVSWLVASYTSHQLTSGAANCTREARTTTGAHENCVSDFGAMDIYGNYWEAVDELLDRSEGLLDYFNGTDIEASETPPALLRSGTSVYNYYTDSFNFTKVWPLAISFTPTSNSERFFGSDWFYYGSDADASNADAAVRRGGDINHNGATSDVDLGSFSVSYASTTYLNGDTTGRCALFAP